MNMQKEIQHSSDIQSETKINETITQQKNIGDLLSEFQQVIVEAESEIVTTQSDITDAEKKYMESLLQKVNSMEKMLSKNNKLDNIQKQQNIVLNNIIAAQSNALKTYEENLKNKDLELNQVKQKMEQVTSRCNNIYH